jgi:hypothetical protein
LQDRIEHLASRQRCFPRRRRNPRGHKAHCPRAARQSSRTLDDQRKALDWEGAAKAMWANRRDHRSRLQLRCCTAAATAASALTQAPRTSPSKPSPYRNSLKTTAHEQSPWDMTNPRTDLATSRNEHALCYIRPVCRNHPNSTASAWPRDSRGLEDMPATHSSARTPLLRPTRPARGYGCRSSVVAA